jgi:membrane-bound lytic murein transglycosylase D
VIVQPGETLGHFADWTKVPSASLRASNKLRKNGVVSVGHKVKLDLSKVTADEFTAARREYHKHLQDEFFASHKIAATETYTVKRGDSLWTIAEQHGDLPVWLISQYNPDVNLGDLHPGTSVTLPQIAAINRR